MVSLVTYHMVSVKQSWINGMARTTREQFLDTAEALFAERGFYGVSIAAIAKELGLTKQALLHHFGSKEKLYGEVLARISERFETLGEQSIVGSDNPEDRLTAFFAAPQLSTNEHPAQTRLLMRELLDNNQRADSASTWYLKPFLKNLIAMVKEVPSWNDAGETEALALVYQWLGAINYFAISEPTLTGIFGEKAHTQLNQKFPHQLERLIEVTVAARS